MLGFFVTIHKINSRRSKSYGFWKAQLVERLDGWKPTLGDSLHEALLGQTKQYESMRISNKITPYLVTERDGPPASGQMVRFIEVDQNGKESGV